MFALLGRRARREVRVVGIGMRVAGTTGAVADGVAAVWAWAWCGRRRVDVLAAGTEEGTAKGCGGPYAGIWNGYCCCCCACGRCVCWYCCCCCWGAYAYTGLRERERAVDAVCTRPGGIAGVLGSGEAKEREGRARWNLTRFIGRRV